jgi:ZipA, C-terminal FtsZ-binding domain
MSSTFQLSTLTVSLIVLLAVTLAAVLGFNGWQSYRSGRRNRPERAPKAGAAPDAKTAATVGAEVSGVSSRAEPSLGIDSEGLPAAMGESPGRAEDALAPLMDEIDDAVAPSTQPARSDESGFAQAGFAEAGLTFARALAQAVSLDEQCDAIVTFSLSGPISGDRLAALSGQIRRVGAKPVYFEAASTHASGDEPVRWEMARAGSSYGFLRAGVQLATRHGPLNAMEFSDFAAAMNALADQIGAGVTQLPMAGVLERARELDALCMQLDAQVGVNVDGHEPMSPVDLQRLAQGLELVQRGNNRYARLGPQAEVLFTVSLADQPGRVTFLLDVPRSPAALRPWEGLVACAQQAAESLQGQLVDDTGRVLAPAALSRIGAQLESRYESLARAGFPAGSPLALRLFN